jgi:DNA-binding FadR family transcriptional regulator
MVQPLPRSSAPRRRGGPVLERLRQALLSGAWAPGERLPPERALALELETNRNTLREALRTLEAEHLVRARQGDGVIALDWRKEGEIPLLRPFLLESTPAQERIDAGLALLGLRDRLFADVLPRAAVRATAGDLLALEHALVDLGHRRCGWPAVEADVALYRCLVESAHSLVHTWVFNTFAAVFLDVGRRLPALFEVDEAYLSGLASVLVALAARDGEEAAERLSLVLEARHTLVEQVLLASLSSTPAEPAPAQSRRAPRAADKTSPGTGRKSGPRAADKTSPGTGRKSGPRAADKTSPGTGRKSGPRATDKTSPKTAPRSAP